MRIAKRYLAKPIGLLLALLAAGLLSGCTSLNFAAGIDDNFTASMSYQIDIDLSSLDGVQRKGLVQELKKLATHYQDQNGFVIEQETIGTDEESYSVLLAKAQPHSTYEEAFSTLTAWLQDESITPFVVLDTTYINEGEQQLAGLNGEIDIPKFLEFSNIDTFPLTLRQQMEQGLQQSSGTVSIHLPASGIQSALGQATVSGNVALAETPLSFTEATPVGLTVRFTEVQGIVLTGTTNEITGRLYIFVAILALLALAAVVFGLVAANKLKKRPAAHPPTSSPQDAQNTK